MSRFLLAIPVFNERDHVLPVIEEVRAYASDILIVNDGSTDGTTEVLRDVDGIQTIHHPENRGYGQALTSAFRHAVDAEFEWLVTMDCDTQHEPSAIPRFRAAMAAGDAELISGSRYLEVCAVSDRPPADRQRINHTITRTLNELLGLELTDAFCGFKAYHNTALRRLQLDIPGYAMPLQLWVQAAWLGLRIREIPVKLIYNDPNRHFGGLLDDPDSRLAHYTAVLARELARTGQIDQAPQLDRLELRSQ